MPPLPFSSQPQIVFIGTKGLSFRSDMALDDIKVTPALCNTQPTTLPPQPTTKVPQPITTQQPTTTIMKGICNSYNEMIND